MARTLNRSIRALRSSWHDSTRACLACSPGGIGGNRNDCGSLCSLLILVLPAHKTHRYKLVATIHSTQVPVEGMFQCSVGVMATFSLLSISHTISTRSFRNTTVGQWTRSEAFGAGGFTWIVGSNRLLP